MNNIGPSKSMVKELVKKKKSWDDDDEDEDTKTHSMKGKKHSMKKSIFSKTEKDGKKRKGIFSRMWK